MSDTKAHLTHGSKKLFAAALKNSELIDNAYFHRGGQLVETEDNFNQIQSLIKHRLAWRLDEDSVQLSSAVMKLLERLGNSAKRQRGSDEIASLWNQLDYLLEGYALLNKKQMLADLDRNINDIHECALEIIEALDDRIQQFAHYIDEQFSTISDLDLRIHHNEHAIKEAQRLNDLLISCSLSDLAIPLNDRRLGKIFRAWLPKKLESCRKELVHILHSLRSQITKLQADSRLAKQLIAFKRHFDVTPGFTPSEIPLSNKIPHILTQSSRASVFGFADITNESHTSTIIDAIKQVTHKINANEANNAPIAIDDSIDQPSTSMDISELYEKSLAVISVAKSGTAISASDAFKQLALDVPYDHWLLALLNTLSGLDNDERQGINIQLDAHEHADFNGNRIVNDVFLS